MFFGHVLCVAGVCAISGACSGTNVQGRQVYGRRVSQKQPLQKDKSLVSHPKLTPNPPRASITWEPNL